MIAGYGNIDMLCEIAKMPSKTQSEENVSYCEVCQAEVRQHFYYAKAGYAIWRCSICGLGWTRVNGLFSPASMYTRDYFEGGRIDGYADYLGSEQILRREFRGIVEELLEIGRTSGTLLEIGCAYGFFLMEAQAHFKVFGIEPCDDAVQFCRSRGLLVSCGIATTASVASYGPLDVVVLLDVIEHLQSPFALLTSIGENMHQGGHLVITTGDWGSFLSRLMGSSWRLMTPPQHLFFFSKRSLREILDRAGFDVIKITRPWKFVPLNLVGYQFARLIGMRPRSNKLLNNIGLPINLFDAMRIVAVKR